MKKILLLLFCATLLFCLIACGGDTQPSACLSHFDNDGDGKCDSCGGDVKTPSEECTVHTDDDGDQKCDSCGAFVPKQKLNIKLIENGQVATQYVDFDGNATNDIAFNPNNSTLAVEGIVSPDGRVLGKMGHSERTASGLYKNVPGEFDLKLFESAVEYFK